MSFCYKILYKSFCDCIFMNGKIIAMNRKQIILPANTYLYLFLFKSFNSFFILFLVYRVEIILFYFIYLLIKYIMKVFNLFLQIEVIVSYLFYIL